MYSIDFSERAKKQLKKLPEQIAKRIFSKIEKLEQDPKPSGHKQLINFDLENNPFNSPIYRIRIGDYRAIYTIEDEVLVILILQIGHRKDIYE